MDLKDLNWLSQEQETAASAKLCVFCGYPAHAGICDRIVAIEFEPHQKTITRIELDKTAS